MEKLHTFIFLTITLFCSSLLAEADYHDVVYLKNGSIIHGIIIEQTENKYIKIKTNDNNVWVFQIEEIEKIDKELNENSTSSGTLVKRKSYFNYERLGILTGEGETIFAAGSINGGRIGNHFIIGFGIEYNDYPHAIIIPLFLELRVNYLSSSITPVSFIDVGSSIGWIDGIFGKTEDGFFLNIGSGVEFQLNNNVSMHIDLSWRKQQFEEYYEFWYCSFCGSITREVDYNFLSLMLGLSF